MKTAMEQVYNQISKLDSREIRNIFYQLLKDGKINFVDISKDYVSYLEHVKQQQSTLNAELAFSLSAFRDDKSAAKRMKGKSAKALIESSVFKGTKYEAKLIEELKHLQ